MCKHGQKKKCVLKKLLEIAIVLAMTIILFKLGRAAAYAERGYEAIGGEYCAFLLPFLWAAIKSFIRDLKDGLFVMREDEDEQ